MGISELPDDQLKRKIRRGYAWLKVHDADVVTNLRGATYDEKRWLDNLSLYGNLVDEARTRGIDENNALEYESKTLIVDNMTPEEIFSTLI